MGYASYTIRRDGEQIEAGYAVEDVCNQQGCAAKIDRGLAYLCGETPGGDEFGCGGYFCADHLYLGAAQQCEACLTAHPADYDDGDDAETVSVPGGGRLA